MSSKSIQQHRYRCVTPPPLPKQAFSSLPNPPYTSLISSPVTPQATHRPPVINTLLQDELYILDALLTRANVHRDTDKTLIDNMRTHGNDAYVNSRSVVVEWISDVSAAFKFQPATLHLAIRHLDWTFSKRFLPQHLYQICCMSALYIAAKCEEPAPNVPTLSSFRGICDHRFDESMMRTMEMYILQLLEWDVVAKTPVHFLTHYIWIVMRRVGQNRRDAHRTCPTSPTSLDFPTRQTYVQDPIPIDFMSDDDETDDDNDDDTVSVISEGTPCRCVGDCSCEDYDMSDLSDAEEESERGHGHRALDLPDSICDRTSSCPGGGRRISSDMTDKDGDRLARAAICLLDLSLYDSHVRSRFPPQVLAATALSIATEISGDTCLRPSDVSGITNVPELAMLDCRAVLWKLFKEAQG